MPGYFCCPNNRFYQMVMSYLSCVNVSEFMSQLLQW